MHCITVAFIINKTMFEAFKKLDWKARKRTIKRLTKGVYRIGETAF